MPLSSRVHVRLSPHVPDSVSAKAVMVNNDNNIQAKAKNDITKLSLKPVAEKLSELLGRTYEAYNNLLRVENIAVSKSCDEEAANYYKSSVTPKMSELRRLVDEMELLTAREAWPMPTYGDLTFSV